MAKTTQSIADLKKEAGIKGDAFYNKGGNYWTNTQGQAIDVTNPNKYGVYANVDKATAQSNWASTGLGLKTTTLLEKKPGVTTTKKSSGSSMGILAPGVDPKSGKDVPIVNGVATGGQEPPSQGQEPPGYEDPLQKEKDQLADEQNKFQQMQADIVALSEQFTTQIGGAAEAFQASFKQLSESLGAQADNFTNSLQSVQDNTGMTVDITQPGFEEAMLKAKEEGMPFYKAMEPYLVGKEVTGNDVVKARDEALKAGGDPDEIAKGYDAYQKGYMFPKQAQDFFNSMGQAPQEKGAEEEVIEQPPPNKNPGAGYSTDVVPESSPSEQVSDAMENIGGMSGSSIMGMLEAAGYDINTMTSAEAMQVMTLQMAMNAADDPTYSDYITRMTEAAANSYQSVIDNASITVEEIDAIISGDDVVPTTFDSLNAKIYKQQADMMTQGIELEKGWVTAQYDAWMTQEQDKRGRLEGYLKGKLYAAGAQDSSAGLAVMALQVNAADMRIQLKASEYQYVMGKLNLESRGIMENFTNNIVGLNMAAEAKVSEAGGKFQDKLFEIEGLAIENDKEKMKLKMDALGTFNDKMYMIDKDKKAQANWEFEQSYKQMRDKVSDAYSLSGLMGSYFYLGPDGEITDSGIPTFDAAKWAESNWLDQMKFQHAIENDSFDQAYKMAQYSLEVGKMNQNNGLIEMMLGMPLGSLSTFATPSLGIDAWAQNVGYQTEGFDNSVGLSAGIPGTGTVISSCYNDGASGGQCGSFMHNFFDLGYSMGDYTNEKVNSLVNVGAGYAPQVGDMVVTNEDPTYGHVAVINSISEDGQTMTLTESNYYQNSLGLEKVSNYREMSVGSSSILGYHHGDLKPEIQAKLDQFIQLQEGSPALDFLAGASGNAYLNSLALSAQTVGASSASNPFVNYVAPTTLDGNTVEASYTGFQNTMFQMLNDPNSSALSSMVFGDLDTNSAMALALANEQWKTQNQDWMGTVTGKQLSSTDIAKLTDAEVAMSSLTNLKASIEENKDLFGPIKGGLAQYNPYDVDTQIMKGKLLNVMQMVGKYMEEGVLRKEDEEKYAKMLPQVNDTYEVALGKLQNVVDTLNVKYQGYYSDYNGSGYNVSAYDPELSWGETSVKVVDLYGNIYEFDDPDNYELNSGLEAGYWTEYN